MLEQSYERSARQETDDTAQFALMQIQTELENAINVARAVIPAMQENKNNITGLTDNGKSSDKIPANLDEQWRQFENKNLNWNKQ